MNVPFFRLFGFLLLLVAHSFNVPAQSPLCLPVGKSPGSINYPDGAVDSLLKLGRYKAVLLGEMHNGSFNPEFQYHLITQLNRTHAFRHFFFEMSASCAWHYNQYLRTGDTSYLGNRSMVANYGQWPVFWHRLHAYNKSLADSQQIVIHGVDFERTEVFATILELAPKGIQPPSSLQAALDTATAHVQDPPLKMFDFVNGKFTEYDHSAFVNALRFIQQQLRDHPEESRAYFGRNYATVREIAENRGAVVVRPKPRNRTMFRSMQRTINEQHIERFAGFFGSQHMVYSQPSSLSNAVRRLSGIRGRDVLAIQTVVYNVRNDANTKSAIDERIIALNGNCKATLMPAKAVKGYRRDADFLLIGNAAN